MKRKRLWLFIAIMLVVGVVISSMALANQKREGEFQKKYTLENATPVNDYGKEDKNKLVEAIASITELPDAVSKYLFWNEPANVKTIKAQLHGEGYEFKFIIQSSLDESKLFTLPGQGYFLLEIPHSNQYLMEYEYNLYLVDAINSSILPLLLDELGPYNIKMLETETVVDHTPDWGSSPHISPDGTLVIFNSTRSTLLGGSTNGETWVKYLDGRDEFPFMERTIGFIGFGPDNEVYYYHEDRIEKINITTRKSEVLVDFSLLAAISNATVIYQPDYNKLNKLNIETNEITEISIENLGAVGNIWTFQNSPYVLLMNKPDRNSLVSELVIYNLKTDKYKKVLAPENSNFSYVNWINKDQFMVSVSLSGQLKEVTYIINLKDVK